MKKVKITVLRITRYPDLMEQYDVPSLGTIRAAQQLLVDEGLIETRQGVGAFVTSLAPRRPVNPDKLVDLAMRIEFVAGAGDRAMAAITRDHVVGASKPSAGDLLAPGTLGRAVHLLAGRTLRVTQVEHSLAFADHDEVLSPATCVVIQVQDDESILERICEQEKDLVDAGWVITTTAR